MISVSGRKWQQSKINNKLVEKIRQDYNFSKIVSQLVVSRNFNQNEIHLIENNLQLSNIFKKNRDFIKSVELLEVSIKNKEINLGTWQGIFLYEHRFGSFERFVDLHFIGD